MTRGGDGCPLRSASPEEGKKNRDHEGGGSDYCSGPELRTNAQCVSWHTEPADAGRECRNELVSGGIPVGGGLSQRFRHGPLDCFRNVAHGAQMRNRLTQPLGDDRLGSRPSVRRLPRQHLVQHTGQAVLVGSAIEPLLGARLLGTHVRRGAEREARFCEPLPPRAAHRQRDPEVRHHRLALVQHDILGLDIAMDDTTAVREVEGRGDRAGKAQRLVERQLAFPLQALAQALALDVRHDVIEEAIRLARVDQRQNVGVLELCGEADLSEEPLGAEDSRKLGAQHLERDRAVVLHVPGQIDRRHPAAPELTLDRVTTREGRPHAF